MILQIQTFSLIFQIVSILSHNLMIFVFLFYVLFVYEHTWFCCCCVFNPLTSELRSLTSPFLLLHVSWYSMCIIWFVWYMHMSLIKWNYTYFDCNAQVNCLINARKCPARGRFCLNLLERNYWLLKLSLSDRIFTWLKCLRYFLKNFRYS